MGGFFLEFANFEEANGLKTPSTLLRVVLHALLLCPACSARQVLGLRVLSGVGGYSLCTPWLDRNPVKSWRYRGMLNRVMLLLFVVSFIILGVLGVKSPTPERTVLAQICTIFYFVFFLQCLGGRV